jgi:hypothetical protein
VSRPPPPCNWSAPGTAHQDVVAISAIDQVRARVADKHVRRIAAGQGQIADPHEARVGQPRDQGGVRRRVNPRAIDDVDFRVSGRGVDGDPRVDPVARDPHQRRGTRSEGDLVAPRRRAHGRLPARFEGQGRPRLADGIGPVGILSS